MTQAANQSEPVKYQTDHSEDEIELIDLLRVIWKWKWIIIGFTLFCVLSVAIYGFTRPVVEMYKVSTVIEINPEAKLGSLQKMKAEIDYGVYNQQILNDLQDTPGGKELESLSFEVAIPTGLNMLDIAYKAPDAKMGQNVLNSLVKQLKKKYERAIEKTRLNLHNTINQKNYLIEQAKHNLILTKKQSELSIAGVKDKIEGNLANIKALQEKIDLAKNRINQNAIILKQAEIRNEKLATQKMRTMINSHLESGDKNVFLDASVIQEIIDYPIVLRDRIDSLITDQKENINEILMRNQNINRLEKEIEILKLKLRWATSSNEEKIIQLKSDIKLLQEDKEQFAAIITKQPIKVSPLIFRYKTLRNIILFGGIGFILSILFVYFIEYIMRVSAQSKKKY